MTLTKEDLIKALVATGMTNDEISNAIYAERNRMDEVEAARDDLILAFESYLETLIPEISITQSDEDYLEKLFLSMEKDLKFAGDILKNAKKPTETKETKDKPKAAPKKEASPDEVLNWFLKELERN